MSCQCYQIGGPFIAEDPSCPKHGLAAQELRQDLLQAVEDLRNAIIDERLPFVLLEYLGQVESKL